jgi:hypothetical protein
MGRSVIDHGDLNRNRIREGIDEKSGTSRPSMREELGEG